MKKEKREKTENIEEKQQEQGCECNSCECDTKKQEEQGSVKELQTQLEELQNKLLYKDAEFINFRRRKEEEVANMLKYASQDLILDILNSVDNFERAIESIKKDDEKDNAKMLSGIEMIYNELKATLDKHGVKEINETEVLFDANIHHAVMTDSIKDKENDIVLEILKKGYILKERVIRPAMVKVNQI